MMSDQNEKIKQGDEYYKEGEKSTKVSFLKRKPNYSRAADKFKNAAICFKNARDISKSKESYLRASDNYCLCDDKFSAAKCLEQAAFLCKEIGLFDEAADLINRASSLLLENGSFDTGALVAVKGAKIVEDEIPEKAIQLYEKAADAYLASNNNNSAIESLGKVSQNLVKLKRFELAEKAIQKEISILQKSGDNACTARLVIALVLVHLGNDDTIAARKDLQMFGSYVESEEIVLIQNLLEAWDNGEVANVESLLKAPFILNMDTEYAKLSKYLINNFSTLE